MSEPEGAGKPKRVGDNGTQEIIDHNAHLKNKKLRTWERNTENAIGTAANVILNNKKMSQGEAEHIGRQIYDHFRRQS